ncbi:uncharacterized protein LOC144369433 [Ictidomys tridecemlineatus]
MCFPWVREPRGQESGEPGVCAHLGWAGASPGLRARDSAPPRPQARSLQTRAHPDPDPGGRDPRGPGGDASPPRRRGDPGPPPDGMRLSSRKLTSGCGLVARSSSVHSSRAPPLPLDWSPSGLRVAAPTPFQALRARSTDAARLPRCRGVPRACQGRLCALPRSAPRGRGRSARALGGLLRLAVGAAATGLLSGCGKFRALGVGSPENPASITYLFPLPPLVESLERFLCILIKWNFS